MNISLKIFTKSLDFCIKMRIIICIRNFTGALIPFKKGVGKG